MLGRPCLRLFFAIAVGCCCGFGAAQAADAPAIVIPGKPGVPVIINGYDASYAVVIGDWGLDRPGQMPATIVTGPLVIPGEHYYGGYFPAFGRRPGYGRREIEPPPNRRLPPPAPSFHRFWGASSTPLPATIDEPSAPDINVDVLHNDRDRRKRHSRSGHR
jgi:hypothetical protein